jgi:beta-lysine N6-acetyltransferase
MPARELVEDIKPVPAKDRAQLGVVELTLGGGHTVKAVGVVYGIEHGIRGEGYSATLFLDQYSQRIRVLDYEATDLAAMNAEVRFLAEENGFDKIIVMASASDWQAFLRFGYVLEAVIRYYHNGADAFVVSKFRSQERVSSPSHLDEVKLIETLMAGPVPESHAPLPAGYELRMARRDDVPELLALYESIFETYPSPLIHESYLHTIFETDSIFAVCTAEGEIVAAASTELNHKDRAAELTDCATKPKARGLGLMTHILRLLEDALRQRSYVCAYTMARGRSFGMNRVFYRLGYSFTGRLINNCDIYGAYEDMNIWVKDLRAS